MLTRQQQRLIWRSAFFLLFLIAPILDIFRFDLTQNQFIFLGQPWILGMADFQTGKISGLEIASNMLLRFFLPLGLIIGGGFFISWKWGRIYCGWLCPHFSIVETTNALMRRASGKLSIWDKKKLPEQQQDGKQIKPHKIWWLPTILMIGCMSFTWAVVLLTYLLPPKIVYGGLWNLDLAIKPSLFIGVASLAFIIEFSFARHLFCRFGCAVGIFQSLVWMANKKAMVVSFNRIAVKNCVDCDQSCEHACPMHLKPRSTKRHMFTCTQCMQCVTACENVQEIKNKTSQTVTLPLLKVLEGECALDASARDFAQKPLIPDSCYDKD